MKVYTCINHAGHYPTGTASVVIAPDQKRAAELLATALKQREDLDQDPKTLDMRFLCSTEHDNSEHVRILCDGDYLNQ